MRFVFAFSVGIFIFALAAVAFGLAMWVLWHFVFWSPFSGLPWGLIRACIALGVLVAVDFARKESMK